MSSETDPRFATFVDASKKLATSLIGRTSYSHGLICSSCHMGSYGTDAEINHVPSCLVGQVLSAARALNEPEEEFYRAEGRPRMGQGTTS